MLANLRREIRLMPWWVQPIGWTGYAGIWTVVQILAAVWWMVRELYSQTIHSLRQIIRPLILPAATIIVAVVLYVVEPKLFGTLLYLVLTLVLMGYGLKIMIFGFRKPKSKKKEGH